VSVAAQTSRSLQKVWWLRALAVLAHPRETFAALRDDSDDAAEARQEPVLALVILAGIAAVLSTSAAEQALNDFGLGDSTFAVLSWAFLGGIAYGATVYFVLGIFIFAIASGMGTGASFRQARHVVAFSAAPLAASLLLVWPVRIAIYGNDLFRMGGSDTGTGARLFDALMAASYLWTLGLVVLGVLELKRSSSSAGIS
jgi:hypothetical protein